MKVKNSGYTLYFIWGNNDGVGCELANNVWRVYLWKFGVGVMKVDLEVLLDRVADKLKAKE